MEGEAEPEEGYLLIRDFYVAEAVNKKGLRRAKKEPQQLEQQDASVAAYPFGCSAKLALFGVFDGHGGRLCALDAAAVLPRHLRKRLRRLLKAQVRQRRPTDLTEVLRDVYRSVDDRLEGNGYAYEGCTATTVVVWSVAGKRYLQSANVGDSTAVLIGVSGPPLVLSVDHKPTLEAERARLRALGIHVNESTTRIGGLAVSRALGDHLCKVPLIRLLSHLLSFYLLRLFSLFSLFSFLSLSLSLSPSFSHLLSF